MSRSAARSRPAVPFFVCVLFLAAPTALRAGLIFRWSLDGSLEDAGPEGRTAVFSGGGEPEFAAGPPGVQDQALRFDGVDDRLDIPGGPPLPLADRLTWSIAFWVRGLPGTEAVVWGEAAPPGDTMSLLRIGADAGGRLEAELAAPDGRIELELRSEAPVLDGRWHHVALVEDIGRMRVWIDGQRDGPPLEHLATKDPSGIEGASVGVLPGPEEPCCAFAGGLADLRLWDHALSEAEVRDLLPLDDCPAEGDTRCGALELEPPEAGPGAAGRWLAVATGAEDDSGDPVLYRFRAESDAGEVLRSGPAEENIAEFELGPGQWTVSVRVDDDPLCPDEAPGSVCVADPVVVGCPERGDTHCGKLRVSAPPEGGPGTWSFDVAGAVDDSGDPVLYRFTAESDAGRRFTSELRPEPFVDLELRGGRWRIEALVDDDPDCPDEAADAVCTTEVRVGCPAEGDTHCDGLIVEAPPEGPLPGLWLATVTSAVDDSGDLIFYTFRATSSAGGVIEVGPQARRTAELPLGAGTWTVEATADDDEVCADRAADAVCREEIEVEPGPGELLGRWPLDGDLLDATGSGNDGRYLAGGAPVFTEGHDGTPSGAILLDGEENACVEVAAGSGLPLRIHRAYTVAFWVRADPQPGATVWGEGSSTSPAPRFAIGSGPSGTIGSVAVRLRSEDGRQVLDRTSAREAFDGEWHHVAWVDDGGRAALWIDGVRDPVDFSYRRPLLPLDRMGIGCLLRAGPNRLLRGAVDDVAVWSRALEEGEILELVPEPADCPAEGDTRCDRLVVEGPAGGVEGRWRLRVEGAEDDSGDTVLTTFRATRDDGRVLQSGPGRSAEAELELGSGLWTLTAVVDDDLACRDRLPGAVCREELEVLPEPPARIARWSFDGGLEDAGPAGLHGVLEGAETPEFVEGPDGTPATALALDGIDDRVVLPARDGLPVAGRREWTLAFRVRGEPQDTAAVYAEGAVEDRRPRFAIGPDPRAVDGTVVVTLRDATGELVLGTRGTEGTAFDGAWHHVAWVVRDGEGEVWIDGRRDPSRFPIGELELPLDAAAIGAVPGAEPCCRFEGGIDEVSVWNHALSAEAIREHAGDLAPSGVPFRRGDADEDGEASITDAIASLTWLFGGGAAPRCLEAADANDDGGADVTDAIYLLNWLFTGGPEPPAPGPPPGPCGPDPRGSPSLGCAAYAGC